MYVFLSFFLALALAFAASKYAFAGKIRSAFWCGFCSGILLRQALGEGTWHYSIDGIHFVQLESIAAFPTVLLFVALIVYDCKRHVFDWGIRCTITSFACNWLGHYVTLGIYPFVSGFVDCRHWNVGFGSICGGIMLAVGIRYLLRRGGTLKGRLFTALLAFIAIGVAALSTLDG